MSNVAQTEKVSKESPKSSTKDDNQIQEKELKDTIQKQNEEIERLNQLKKTDDIAPGIRTTKTFEAGYRNGYEDGTVKEFIKKAEAKQALEAQVEQ